MKEVRVMTRREYKAERNFMLLSILGYIAPSLFLLSVRDNHGSMIGPDVTLDFIRNNPALSWVYDHPFGYLLASVVSLSLINVLISSLQSRSADDNDTVIVM